MNLLGPPIPRPDWIEGAVPYYSHIESIVSDPVWVMKYPVDGQASEENPGTPFLRLVPGSRELEVVDADNQTVGVIHSRGPGLGYTMKRNGASVWSLSTRSLVFRRHALQFAGGEQWDVRTPFFWWMHILCGHQDSPRVLGRVGPRKSLWQLWLPSEANAVDVLSALALLHRRWWRS